MRRGRREEEEEGDEEEEEEEEEEEADEGRKGRRRRDGGRGHIGKVAAWRAARPQSKPIRRPALPTCCALKKMHKQMPCQRNPTSRQHAKGPIPYVPGLPQTISPIYGSTTMAGISNMFLRLDVCAQILKAQ